VPTKGIVKLKKKKKGEEKSTPKQGKYSNDTNSYGIKSTTYAAGKEDRASNRAIERADAISNQRAKLQSLKATPPTKKDSRQKARAQNNFFKGVNKNQTKVNEAAFNRQNTNTGGIQSSVLAVEKAFKKGKSIEKIGKISARTRNRETMNMCEGGKKGRM